MTSHEYARYLLKLEDLPLLVHNARTETSTYIDGVSEVYWKPEWHESIFKEEVVEFGHTFEEVQKAWEIYVE